MRIAAGKGPDAIVAIGVDRGGDDDQVGTLRASRSRLGHSFRQGPHQLAQKLTRTILPRSASTDSGWPSADAIAGNAGRAVFAGTRAGSAKTGKAPMAARITTRREDRTRRAKRCVKMPFP